MPQEIYHHTFANGLTLLAERMEHVRSAAFNFLIPAGSVYDPPRQLGMHARHLGQHFVERDAALVPVGAAHLVRVPRVHPDHGTAHRRASTSSSRSAPFGPQVPAL